MPCTARGGVGGDNENRSSVDSGGLSILGAGGTCGEGTVGGTRCPADVVGRGGGCKALCSDWGSGGGKGAEVRLSRGAPGNGGGSLSIDGMVSGSGGGTDAAGAFAPGKGGGV